MKTETKIENETLATILIVVIGVLYIGLVLLIKLL